MGASLRLHDLRHSFASVGSFGFGLPAIGKLLGHSNSKTTERDAHLAADPLRRASDAISGSIARPMGDPVAPEPSKNQSYEGRALTRGPAATFCLIFLRFC